MNQQQEIAIIGMGCRFPQGETPSAFWQLLSDGVDAISEVPADRWNIDELYDPEPVTPGKMNTRWGGFLEQVDGFDPLFFNISPREAERIDPQQRLFLEVAWEALENAGVAADKLAGSLTGVFAAMAVVNYDQLLYKNVADLERISAYDGIGTTLSLASSRLSYLLDLKGPSLAVETACSSSLVAVHLACQSLRLHETNLSIVGGVNLILTPELNIVFSQARMMSPDGRCKTFDADANGYVRGEGCGVVILKRLSDAIADGDNILAVIKGSAVNQDGTSNGITAPNGPSQQAVIRQALANAGVAPAEISYVETHGTGTPLGDPIEVNSLKRVLMTDRTSDRPCYLGSVKTNIGHLESAAGIAGLIKVILALQHQEIPANLHLKKLNPYIRLKKTSLKIPTEKQPWEVKGKRIAGISSFGFGGTNAHVVLGEFPKGFPIASETRGRGDKGTRRAAHSRNESEWTRPRMGAERLRTQKRPVPCFARSGAIQPRFVSSCDDWQRIRVARDKGKDLRPLNLLTLSAKSDCALVELAQRYSNFIDSQPEVPLADICYTANTGRAHFERRLTAIASSTTDLKQSLQTFARGEETPKVTTGCLNVGSPPHTAFLFTGQGSQYLGMGQELYQTHPGFRQALDRCGEILEAYLDIPLLEVLYPPVSQSPSLPVPQLCEAVSFRTPIDQTQYTQPAIFAIEYALAQLWQSWGIEPSLVMGHSVGEYVAACIAGVFSLEDGLKLIAERGRLMQSLPQDGAMVSLLAEPERVNEAIAPYNGKVAIAAYNGAKSTVISGKAEAVKDVAIELESQGVKAKYLQVSHGFHSPLMQPILADFARVARTVDYSLPQLPFVSNLTGELVSDEVTTAQYWCDHILQPVRFAEGIKTLSQQPPQILLEIGAKPILLGMARLSLADREADYTFLPSLRPSKSDWQQMLESSAELYLQGANIDWQSFETDYSPRRKRELPTYPFQRQSYWAKPIEKRDTTSYGNSLLCLLERGEISGVTSQLAKTASLSAEEVKLLPKLLNLLTEPNNTEHSPIPTSTKTVADDWQSECDRLLSAPSNERKALLKDYFARLLARTMKIAPSDLDWQQRLSNLGMDSLMGAELRRQLETQLAISVPVEFLAELNLTQFLEQLLYSIEQQQKQKIPDILPYPDNSGIITQNKRETRYRLFCLPYAGGGASIYRNWQQELPAEIEVCPIQLPGRENLLRETAQTRIKPLIKILSDQIEPYLDLPYAIFGHSLGAWVGFELIRELRRRQLTIPSRFLVSGSKAPQLLDLTPPIHRLPDDKFIAKIESYQGTPPAVLQNKELLEQFLPILRADFAVLETYFYTAEAVLDCPIAVFGGKADTQVTPAQLSAWQQQTAKFDLQMFDGDHFFLNSARQELLKAIATTLEQQLLILN